MNQKVNELLDVAYLRQKFNLDKNVNVQNLIGNKKVLKEYLKHITKTSQNNKSLKKLLWATLLLFPTLAFAGDPVTIVTNFVSVMITKIFPTLNLGYFGKAVFLIATDDPNANKSIVRVVISSACLLGINGVWRFIQAQAN